MGNLHLQRLNSDERNTFRYPCSRPSTCTTPIIELMGPTGIIKLLIDTGSHLNLLKRYVCSDYYKSAIGAVQIKLANGFLVSENIYTLSFQELGGNPITFYEFSMDSTFDGVIGYALLKQLKAEINCDEGTIKLGNTRFKTC